MRMVLLLQERECTINEFKIIEGLGQNQIYKNIDNLKILGLIEERKGPNNSRIISLTSKGQEVAEILFSLSKKLVV